METARRRRPGESGSIDADADALAAALGAAASPVRRNSLDSSGTASKELGFRPPLRETPRTLKKTVSQASTSAERRTESPFPSRSISSEVELESLSPAVREYVDWAVGRTEVIHSGFTIDDKSQYAMSGATGRRGLTVENWAQLLRRLGFRGDADAVFHMAASELRNDKEDMRRFGGGSSLRSVRHSMYAPTISLSQLQRMEKRLAAMDAKIGAHAPGSPVGRFVDFLKKHRGTALRAFRLDLDQRGIGKVAYMDFARACRKLGVQGQARSLWKSLCPDDRPLEFSGLDPAESDNLQSFAAALSGAVGVFDADEAWQAADAHRQGLVALGEFVDLAERLHFEGDARLLFRGLDKLGLGRLHLSDFEYIRCVMSKGRAPHQSLNPTSDLVAWAHREYGAAQRLMPRLVYGKADGVSVHDLASRLSSLGFVGDAVRTAAAVARFESGPDSGTWISAESLAALLSGEPCPWAKRASTQLLAAAADDRRKSLSSSPPVRKLGWDGRVSDISLHNAEKYRDTRALFDGGRPAPEAEAQTPSPRTSRISTAAPTPSLSPRPRASPREEKELPQWDSRVIDVSMTNRGTTPRNRQYFSDPHSRPVREKILAQRLERHASAQ